MDQILGNDINLIIEMFKSKSYEDLGLNETAYIIITPYQDKVFN